MASNFMNTVQVKTPQTSTFDLSHDHKLTCNMGELIPFMCKEAIPGDRWHIRHEHLTRFLALLSPVMQRFKIRTYDFFVPNRIINSGWEKWISGRDTTSLPPTINVNSADNTRVAHGSLADYLGLVPVKQYKFDFGNDVNALPFAAYQRIWFDWFRDQNLQLPLSDAEDFDLPQGVTDSDSSHWNLPHVQTHKSLAT